jgi:hypothetical protein
MESDSQKATTKTTTSQSTTTNGKESKKDRHMNLTHSFSKFLEKINELTIQSVLLLRRTSREHLESCDIDLSKFILSISSDSYLLDKTENQLINKLEELKVKLTLRETSINTLQIDLDNTEIKKAQAISAELKTVVDKLIAIGHQLPDDIERFVENETFEINKEVISNRMEHTKFVSELRISHVKYEAEYLEKWEDIRRKWRNLRHEKALNIFRNDIQSDQYNNPLDRKQYMENFRQEQEKRRKVISSILNDFSSLQYTTMTIEQVTELQNKLTVCNEKELEAVQSCYNGLTSLRSTTSYYLRERVEDLRKELHVYGSLKVDPKLLITAKQLENAVNDSTLTELWRLGGGLKPDFQSLINEMKCDEIVYNRVVISMKEKLELIISSFNLKSILEEKGRLIQLDKIRNMIIKIRNSPRNEIPNLLKALMIELEEISKMEKLPKIFQESILTIIKEIEEEFINLEKRISQINSISSASNTLLPPRTGTINVNTVAANSTSTKGGGAPIPPSSTTNKTMTVSEKTSGKSRDGTTSRGGVTKKGDKSLTSTLPGGTSSVSSIEIMSYIDPVLLKGWHRKLAILFYGSDIPLSYQSLCLEIMEQVSLQYDCNLLVDEVIIQESEKQLKIMDLRYGKLIDTITTYLENQTNYLFIQASNISNFYLTLASLLEKHRSDQKTIDNKSADELWDLAEDFRFQHEDLENEYKSYCNHIRKSTKQDDINEHFTKILEILNTIQEAYRTYHKNACFAADRYPLYTINEYRSCLVSITSSLFMHPKLSHHIMTQYHRIFDQTERLNAVLIENNPSLIPFSRISDEEILGNVTYSGEIFISPNGENEDDYESTNAFSGSYQLLITFNEIISKFGEESFFKFINPSSTAVLNTEENKEEVGDENIPSIKLSVGFTPHSQYPFLKEETTIFPKSTEELEALSVEEKEEYEKLLVKYFLPINDYQTKFATNPDELTAYETIATNVEKIKERIALEASSDYIRSHIPIDSSSTTSLASPWIHNIEITYSELSSLYSSIRCQIFQNIEIESMKKVLTVEHDMSSKKTELTNELEDRIRNHWPRRGRVETEIKQPREMELSSHKDKTYRIILLVQNKMIEIQNKFFSNLEMYQTDCTRYIEEVEALSSLCHNHYKNLATLQGIDMKARSITLEFQNENNKKVLFLQKILTSDILTIINNAKDFRKLCPLQQPGDEVNGGYSESELTEIEILINNQINEIQELTSEWSSSVVTLQEQQTTSLKTYDEFLIKYGKAVQEVAMAEGLGQKYGAPRRRAQERIRTEISLDEKKSSKVDEFLSQIDFLSAEIHISIENSKQNDSLILFEDSSVAADGAGGGGGGLSPMNLNTTATSLMKNVTFQNSGSNSGNNVSLVSQGIDNLKSLHLLWSLLKVLKDLTMKRVTFLNIIGENGYPTTVDIFPWINEMRFYELNELIPASSPVDSNGSNSPRVSIPVSTTTIVHSDRFLEEMKEITENVLQNSIVVEAIPSNNNSGDTGNVGNNTKAADNKAVTGRPPSGKPGKSSAAGGGGAVTGGGGGGVGGSGGIPTLEIVFEEINQNCRKETKQLYESEGLLSALNSGKSGVPESLEIWLSESHSKIFGSKGYREKAWKRVWNQIEKLDLLLIRNRSTVADESASGKVKRGGGEEGPESEAVSPSPSSKHGKTTESFQIATSTVMSAIPSSISSLKVTSIQSAIFFYYTKSMIVFSQNDYLIKYNELEKLLKVWEKSKDKNERLLRPKLASPDRVDELNDLNNLELQRSNDLTTTTIQFRNFMIRKQMLRFRYFIDDLVHLGKALILYIDSMTRLELLALPPDTEIPKKHLTLKKLRKAQRIREEVAKGGVDRSKRRQWPSIEIDEICQLIKDNEDLLTDLGKDPLDFTGGVGEGSSPVPGDDVKTKKGSAVAAPAGKKGSEKSVPKGALAAATANPSLVPQIWIEKMKELSIVEGLVSSAQRVVVEERILAIARYKEYLKYFFAFMRDDFNKILKQEESWNERWKRQVQMLKNGNSQET